MSPSDEIIEELANSIGLTNRDLDKIRWKRKKQIIGYSIASVFGLFFAFFAGFFAGFVGFSLAPRTYPAYPFFPRAAGLMVPLFVTNKIGVSILLLLFVVLTSFTSILGFSIGFVAGHRAKVINVAPGDPVPVYGVHLSKNGLNQLI